ncbi:MAG TPA: hypothetical protein VEV82_00830 [Actinomycetota bacterium]|nr:hypothetical protein [Actinomycetota bacterium]
MTLFLKNPISHSSFLSVTGFAAGRCPPLITGYEVALVLDVLRLAPVVAVDL